MIKRVVRYDPSSVIGKIRVGPGGVLLRPLNHSDTENVSNTGLVLTSPVLGVGESGVFETQNSYYVPQLKRS